jgi:hypothetical protein
MRPFTIVVLGMLATGIGLVALAVIIDSAHGQELPRACLLSPDAERDALQAAAAAALAARPGTDLSTPAFLEMMVRQLLLDAHAAPRGD